MDLMRNPAAMQEMMRQQDRVLSNLEVHNIPVCLHCLVYIMNKYFIECCSVARDIHVWYSFVAGVFSLCPVA